MTTTPYSHTADIPLSSQRRALVDCDSFFAGCEVARRPELRGKCVCVGRDEDIVVASTYEAKVRGVKTGTPAWEARKILGDDAVFIRPDLHYYQEVSRQVMAILAEESNAIEVYSVDEAFIDITHHLAIQGDPDLWYAERARAIQRRVQEELGISVSVGVAPTRILAKICAGLRKPHGVLAHTSVGPIHAILGAMPVTTIPFISHKRASKLAQCQTVRDFLDAPLTYIQEIMGGSGTKLRYEMHGTNAISLQKPLQQKMIERTRSFHPHFTNDKQLVRAYLVSNFERAYRALIAARGGVRTLRVSCRLQSFGRRQQSHTFPRHTADREILLSTLRELFELVYSPREMYRTTGVSFMELRYGDAQPSLFGVRGDSGGGGVGVDMDLGGGTDVSKSEKVQRVIGRLQEKYGKVVVTSATDKGALGGKGDVRVFG